MKKGFTYFFTATMLLANCSSGEPKSKSGICYVLCDFSKSLEMRSRQRIVNNALAIFGKSLQNHKFKYYDIGASQYDGPFFEYTDSSYMILKPQVREAVNSRRNRLFKDSLNKQLFKFCMAQGSKSTCIINALDKVANSLVSKAENHQKHIVVYILSDMLEDCGAVKLDNASLTKIPEPLFTFKGYDIEIMPVVSSEKNTDPRKLFEFWKKVFEKYNYSLPVLQTEL